METYVVKTERAEFYEVIDESHLWSPDTWIVMVEGARHIVLSFGDVTYRQSLIDLANGRPGARAISSLQGEVRSGIERGTCLGHQLVFVEETLLAPYLRSRVVPQSVWKTVAHDARTSHKIISVYKRIF